MKKKMKISLLVICLAAGLAACGSNGSVKVIEKDTSLEETDLSFEGEEGETNQAAGQSDDIPKEMPSDEKNGEKETVSEGDKPLSQSGYMFKTDGISGSISLTVDMVAAPVINALGEPKSYFEAPSCAFMGVDKIYTYSHFEIDTYPDGGTDKISMILFLDDLVTTPEGICIGMTIDDIKRVYGNGYEEVNGAYVYKKNNTKLTFLVKNGEISSIEYTSMVLEN